VSKGKSKEIMPTPLTDGWEEDKCVCRKCGHAYALREGCDPTPFCDACAHDEVDRLTARLQKIAGTVHLIGSTSPKPHPLLKRILKLCQL